MRGPATTSQSCETAFMAAILLRVARLMGSISIDAAPRATGTEVARRAALAR